MLEILLDFLPKFLQGVAVNLAMSLWALPFSIVIGWYLMKWQLSGGVLGAIAKAVLALFRAAPTFVLIFFIFNVLSFKWQVAGFHLGMSPFLAVVLSLIGFGVPYVADSSINTQRGASGEKWLMIMSWVRGFFVMVLSSGMAAAVGVNEGMAEVLRAIEVLPTVRERLYLIAAVTVFYTVLLQTIYHLMAFTRRKLEHR
jgi:hypothetical protein